MDTTGGSGGHGEQGEHGGHEDQADGIWLKEEGPTGGRSGTARRRTAVVVAVVVCLAVAAIPVSLALAGSGGPGRQQAGDKIVKGDHLGSAANAAKVLSALSATTDSSNFDFTYHLNGQAGPSTTTTTQSCQIGEPASGASLTTTPCDLPSSSLDYPPVSGTGIINVNPTALVASAVVGSGSGFDVAVRVSDTQFWLDLGGTEVGLAPSSTTDNPGQDVIAFADVVDGELDAREGPVAMMALAGPSGYLDLYQSEFSSAEDLGPSTVAGTPVTVYQVQISPAGEAQVPGATTDEQTTITNALTLLANEGYTGTTVKVSIDAEGYILQSDSTANFSDGGSVDLDTTFSNFGCAGTILFPGQTGPSTPPADCTSPVPSTTVPATAPATTTPSASPSTTEGSTPPTVAPATSTPAPGSTGTTSPTGPSTSTTDTAPSTTTTGGG
jgi:hypothetical protein